MLHIQKHYAIEKHLIDPLHSVHAFFPSGKVTFENEHSQSAAIPKYHSQSPRHTSSKETGRKNAVNESGLSKQDQHHYIKDVACPDNSSEPHLLPPLSSAISKYQDYLKSVYEVRPTLLDDKLLISPCAQYINLAIIKKE